jgi:hypothetical protein
MEDQRSYLNSFADLLCLYFPLFYFINTDFAEFHNSFFSFSASERIIVKQNATRSRFV